MPGGQMSDAAPHRPTDLHSEQEGCRSDPERPETAVHPTLSDSSRFRSARELGLRSPSRLQKRMHTVILLAPVDRLRAGGYRGEHARTADVAPTGRQGCKRTRKSTALPNRTQESRASLRLLQSGREGRENSAHQLPECAEQRLPFPRCTMQTDLWVHNLSWDIPAFQRRYCDLSKMTGHISGRPR